MFLIIRIIVVVTLILSCLLIKRKAKIENKRRLYVILFVVIFILIELISVFPIENLFYTFDSPKEVLDYTLPNSYELKLVVEGKHSDLAVAKNGNTESLYVIPKTSEGWKIYTAFDGQQVAIAPMRESSVRVFKNKDSNDFYVRIGNSSKKKLKITDSYNSEFQVVEKEIPNFGVVVDYYAYIPDFDSKYKISIDENEVKLTQFPEIKIMWKEILIILFVLFDLRFLFDLYCGKKFKKIHNKFISNELDGLYEKTVKLQKKVGLASNGLFNSKMREMHNSLCVILASIMLLEGNERGFLTWFKYVKKEEECETKHFLLVLYYRYKEDKNLMMYSYNKYMACIRSNENFKIIMQWLFSGNRSLEGNEELINAVKNIKNPAIIKLLEMNNIIS